jgi:RHS repeat-associated protein
LEETDDQGNPLADYIYLDNQPVAVLSPSAGQGYFLHDDRLGTPQFATDSSQSIVWTASYGPFGEIAAVPSLIVQNLRLPGQEYDTDTGLYHNGFRDYAPGRGRYLQSDPIGLIGGLNTYAYAGSNPVTEIDPLGLQTGQDGSNAYTDFKNWVGKELDAASVQITQLKKDGLSQYFDETFPETHVCATELVQEAKNLWDKLMDAKEIYDLYDYVEKALDGEFLGFLGLGSELFKLKANSGDSWGAYCNPNDTSCNNYMFQQPMHLAGPTGR